MAIPGSGILTGMATTMRNLFAPKVTRQYPEERPLRRISDRMVIHWAQVFGASGLGGFRLLPAEGHVITVCTCAACRFAGGEALLREGERLLGVRAGESTPDGAFTLETSSDVAAGALAPAVRIDTLVYGPLTAEHLGHLVEQRGGAGFPTARKWQAARAAEGDRKIAVANLIGADPTSLGDRALAEGNPHLIVEGLLVSAFAVGASEAIIAVRRDWQRAVERLRQAVEQTAAAHLSGYLVLGTDVTIQISVEEGSGAYVAGEETALLAALAGDRGMPVIRPPYPATRGLWGVPTLVQNADTLAHVARILAHSPDA